MKKNKAIGIWSIALILGTTLMMAGCAEKAEEKQEENRNEVVEEAVVETVMEAKKEKMVSPILDQDGADPFVYYDGNGYLYTKTTGGNVSLAYSDSLLTVGSADWKVVYEPGNELKDLWAPEIWHLDDGWYIYFAATVPGEEMHFMYVLSNLSENPMEGEWHCEPLKGMDDKFAIDGTILELADKRYFLWSGWEVYQNVSQNIYIAEMLSPTEVKEEKILLSRPEYKWERIGNPLINEGPEILIDGNTVNLVYSASGSWTDAYCLGLLTMDTESDPTVPENWTKHEEPVMSRVGDVYGPGHNSFTVSKDGNRHIIVYHAARWKSSGWTRSIRFGYVELDGDGVLQEIVPVSGDEKIAIPSGEEEVEVYTPDCFVLTGEVEVKETEDGQVAEGFLSTSDKIAITVNAEESREVTVVVPVKTEDRMDGITGGVELLDADGAQSKPLYAAENYQPVCFRVNLHQGSNEIVIRSDMGGTLFEINRIEIRY